MLLRDENDLRTTLRFRLNEAGCTATCNGSRMPQRTRDCLSSVQPGARDSAVAPSEGVLFAEWKPWQSPLVDARTRRAAHRVPSSVLGTPGSWRHGGIPSWLCRCQRRQAYPDNGHGGEPRGSGGASLAPVGERFRSAPGREGRADWPISCLSATAKFDGAHWGRGRAGRVGQPLKHGVGCFC